MKDTADMNISMSSSSTTSYPEHLYGRIRGHALRAHQQTLLKQILPQIRFGLSYCKDPKTAFSSSVDKIWLEIGFGSGEHTFEQHIREPNVGIIGSEVFENGICSFLLKITSIKYDNPHPFPSTLRLFDNDARLLLKELPDNSLDKIFLLFPDPWPKSRHTKRRFVHPQNLDHIARVLKSTGEWRIATDDVTYQKWIVAVMKQQIHFHYSDPMTKKPREWPATRYEIKAINAKRQPLYWSFTKK